MNPAKRVTRAPRGGFTLIEVLLSAGVLFVAATFGVQILMAALNLSDSSNERVLAYQGAQNVIEEMRDLPLDEVFARYNSTAADNPAGTCPGPNFGIAGLRARNGDADGLVGEIILPEDPNDATVLLESLNDRGLGLPGDLDLNGTVDVTDVSSSYRWLPVLVRVRWLGKSGSSTLQVSTVLGGI